MWIRVDAPYAECQLLSRDGPHPDALRDSNRVAGDPCTWFHDTPLLRARCDHIRKTHPVPNSAIARSLKVLFARFMTSAQVPRYADGALTGLPGRTIVCYVLGKGHLQFLGPPD